MCTRKAYLWALVFVLCPCISAATYYVDIASTGSGDGTSQATSGTHAAWKNLSEINGLAPGDTVLLRRGNIWQELLDVTVSGTSDRPIMFAAYGSGENPIITALRQRNYCIEISEEDYIIIDGIDCHYAREQNIVLYKANYCIVRNLTTSYSLMGGVRICYGSSTGNLIENVTAHHNGEPDHGGGILLDTGVTRNIVRFCKCYQNAEDGTGSGGWPGNYAGPDNIFEYNECYDNHESGMDIKSGPQIIRFNKLYNNHGTYDNEGEGIALTYDSKNVKVYGNEIYGNDWNGIRISSSNEGGGHIITYNRIYDNAKRGIYGEGTSSLSNEISHNLIYDNAHYGVFLRTPQTDVRNNIIWGNVDDQLRIYSAYNTVRHNILGGRDNAIKINADGNTGLTLYYNCIIETGNIYTLDWSLYDSARWSAFSLLDGSPDSQDLGAVVAVDGSSLYFHSDRPGGEGGFDLWTTVRDTLADNWIEPDNMSKNVNSGYDDEWPWIFEDGLTLLFSSNRPEGHGGYDLWMTTRMSATDNWNAPVNLGPKINREGTERRSWISPDGRILVYESDRASGSVPPEDIYDLYVTTREGPDGDWGNPAWLAKAINMTFDNDGLCVINGNPATYFVSERPDGGWYLWQASLVENPDYNQHSLVDFRELLLGGDLIINGGDYDLPTGSVVEGFETGDFSRFDWVSLGDAEWNVTSDEYKYGIYSAKAGPIEDNESTTLRVAI
ncbi:MAG: right-handed parallel beta-helix repeat-containing protein, partial [Planctomycetota bacterium]